MDIGKTKRIVHVTPIPAPAFGDPIPHRAPEEVEVEEREPVAVPVKRSSTKAGRGQ